MRIAFDGTALRPRRAGVGYYTEHLLHHLAQEAPADEIIVLSNKPIDTTTSLPANVRVVQTRWPMPRIAWMQTWAPQVLSALRPDVAHFTGGMMPFTGSTPTVVTIHDMSLTLFPHYHPTRRLLLNRPLVDLAARQADAVVTVSESSKRDIVRLCDLSEDRLHVVHEAAAAAFRPVRDRRELDRVRRRYGLGDPIILYVGTIEPRKNLRTLIDAFARRRQTGDLNHQLVCVGPYGWLTRGIAKQIEQLHVADAITFTGYVPFADLPALYSLAEIFVFPSVYEGFGLPVIEAMACGTPVIASRAQALTEIAGGAVDHVDELDADSLGEALVTLARHRERREHLAALGLERARAFSWKRAARDTLEVYRRAVKRPGAASTRTVTPAFAEVGAGEAAVREARRPWTP